MEESIFSGQWIVALCSSGKYVGRVEAIREADPGAADGPSYRLSPCYEVYFTMIPMQNQQSGQLVHVPHMQVMPVLMSTGDTPMSVIPSAVVSFDEMTSFDLDNWRRMILGAREIQTKERAERSGIELATSLPNRH
jgi:hypothetical protein